MIYLIKNISSKSDCKLHVNLRNKIKQFNIISPVEKNKYYYFNKANIYSYNEALRVSSLII